MGMFDSNQDGGINYNEFLFMFVDRGDILSKWRAYIGADGVEMKPLERDMWVARLRSALLTASTDASLRGDGLITREAAERVLTSLPLFTNKVCASVALLCTPPS